MTFDNDWDDVLGGQMEQPYFAQLWDFIHREYEEHSVYPAKENIFQALRVTPYADVKAVILGQDPYHGPGQAHGLSFSVNPGVPHPPSLRNILCELNDDIGVPIPKNGCLLPWAEQGVLLLNTVLTVREGQPNSHKSCGWERFTDAVIAALNAREEPVAFLLWGNHAQEKEALLDGEKHFILRSPHPSPLSARRGFFGSRPFSRVNAWLAAQGKSEIDWRLPEEREY